MKNYQTLLQKKLTRFEFLKMVGVITLSITGIQGILNTLSNPNTLNLKNKKSSKTPFGNGGYGV